jgi:hypothetical protein
MHVVQGRPSPTHLMLTVRRLSKDILRVCSNEVTFPSLSVTLTSRHILNLHCADAKHTDQYIHACSLGTSNQQKMVRPMISTLCVRISVNSQLQNRCADEVPLSPLVGVVDRGSRRLHYGYRQLQYLLRDATFKIIVPCAPLCDACKACKQKSN